MKDKLALASVLVALSTSALAQSAVVNLAALTPQVAEVSDGTQAWTSTVPVGPLAAVGSFGGGQFLQGAPRDNTVTWWSSVGAEGVEFTLENFVSGGPAGSVATTGPSEMLVTITGTGGPAVPWRLEGGLETQFLPITTALFDVDVGNDGTIDWTSTTFGPIGAFGPDLTAQPLQIRIVFRTTHVQEVVGVARLWLRVGPANVSALRVASNCYNPNTFVATPLMWSTADISFGGSAGSGLSWKLLGLSLTPTALPISLSGTPLPCMALPSPDWLWPTPLVFVRIPQAVRPITFYAQSLDLVSGGLRTSDTFVVTAN